MKLICFRCVQSNESHIAPYHILCLMVKLTLYKNFVFQEFGLQMIAYAFHNSVSNKQATWEAQNESPLCVDKVKQQSGK